MAGVAANGRLPMVQFEIARACWIERHTNWSLPFIKDFTSNVRHHKGKSFMIATYLVVLLLAFHALKIATYPGSGAIIKDF